MQISCKSSSPILQTPLAGTEPTMTPRVRSLVVALTFSLHLFWRGARCASTASDSLQQQNETLMCTMKGFDLTAEYRWLNNIIPYSIDENLPDATKRSVASAMTEWERDSCFMFVPRNTEAQFISFENRSTDRCCPQNTGRTNHLSFHVNSCSRPEISTLIGSILGINQTEHLQAANDEEPRSHACEEHCGGKINAIMSTNHTEDRGNIHSPNHPNHYPSHLDCMWKIGAPAGYGLRVSFHAFDVEASRNCVYDYLEITNVNSEGGIVRRRKLCSSPPLTSLNSETIEREVDMKTAAVLIHFHSDDTYTGDGFMLEYQLLDESRDPCSTDNGGCSQICASDPSGKHTCGCREGYTISSDGRSCSDLNECTQKKGGCQQRCRNTEGSFYCACRSGYRLNSDMTTCSECTIHANSSSGEIFSRHFPAPYEHSENCVWTITPWTGRRLQITIHFLDILHSYKCKDDYLKFQFAHFPNQRRMCGHYHDITYVIDRATSLRFRSSEANTQHSGFKLSYKQVDAADGDMFVRVRGDSVPYRRRHWIQAG